MPSEEQLITALANIFECGVKDELYGNLQNVGVVLLSEDQVPRSYGKAKFTRLTLQPLSQAELIRISDNVLKRFTGDSKYEEKLAELRAILPNTLKNSAIKTLLFAGTHKPDVILKSLITNELEIRSDGGCLHYDLPISGNGLTWGELFDWYNHKHGRTIIDFEDRLKSAIPTSSPMAILLFKVYWDDTIAKGDFNAPALLPEFWLHYDPYSRRDRGGVSALPSQRVDFLLLMQSRLIIIEVDGAHHYSKANGSVDEEGYASQVAFDRDRTLDGYEVYRFGLAELRKPQGATAIQAFFKKLLNSHSK